MNTFPLLEKKLQEASRDCPLKSQFRVSPGCTQKYGFLSLYSHGFGSFLLSILRLNSYSLGESKSCSVEMQDLKLSLYLTLPCAVSSRHPVVPKAASAGSSRSSLELCPCLSRLLHLALLSATPTASPVPLTLFSEML